MLHVQGEAVGTYYSRLETLSLHGKKKKKQNNTLVSNVPSRAQCSQFTAIALLPLSHLCY